MQYLVSVIDATAGRATQDEMAAIDVFNERLTAEGHWVFAAGLAGPDSATPGRSASATVNASCSTHESSVSAPN